MILSDFPINPSRRVLRQFAGAWLVVLLVLAWRRWLGRHDTVWAPCLAMLAVVIGGMGLVWPRTLRWLFVGLMALAFPMRWVISQVALVVLFYGVITPLAMVMRMKGRDHLRLKQPGEASSYWHIKQASGDLRRYFRQY